MRKASVKLIKLTTRHTYAASLRSLLCSRQFGSQGKMYGSQIPSCITTQTCTGMRLAHPVLVTMVSFIESYPENSKFESIIKTFPRSESIHRVQLCPRFRGAVLWEGSTVALLQTAQQHCGMLWDRTSLDNPACSQSFTPSILLQNLNAFSHSLLEAPVPDILPY